MLIEDVSSIAARTWTITWLAMGLVGIPLFAALPENGRGTNGLGDGSELARRKDVGQYSESYGWGREQEGQPKLCCSSHSNGPITISELRWSITEMLTLGFFIDYLAPICTLQYLTLARIRRVMHLFVCAYLLIRPFKSKNH